jgi:hypothetical protein
VLYYLGNREARAAADRERTVEVTATGTSETALVLVRGTF